MTVKTDLPKKATKKTSSAKPDASYLLKLYIAGQTTKSKTAIENLNRICVEHLDAKYRVEVIDLLQQPQLAEGEQILAVPTLVKTLPEPVKRIIGDLSNTERVIVGLDIKPDRNK